MRVNKPRVACLDQPIALAHEPQPFLLKEVTHFQTFELCRKMFIKQHLRWQKALAPLVRSN